MSASGWRWGGIALFLLLCALVAPLVIAWTLGKDELYRRLGEELVGRGAIGQLAFLGLVVVAVAWRLWFARASRDYGLAVRIGLSLLTVAVGALYLLMLWG